VVDLCAAGISVRTTRYGERNALAASWAERVGADLAINSDLFEYGSCAVLHWARSGGADWPPGTHDREPHPNVAFGPNLAVRGGLPPVMEATDILGGIPEFTVNGAFNEDIPGGGFTEGAHRRTAAGLSDDRRTLFVFVSDGGMPLRVAHDTMALLAAAVPGAPRVHWALNLEWIGRRRAGRARRLTPSPRGC
jgi:hypothetical protein